LREADWHKLPGGGGNGAESPEERPISDGGLLDPMLSPMARINEQTYSTDWPSPNGSSRFWICQQSIDYIEWVFSLFSAFSYLPFLHFFSASTQQKK
jgi:hypothetical protein